MAVALSAASAAYPHTEALKSGRIRSHLLQLECVDIAPVNRAFAPMARERRFDVSEMAIATFLQARPMAAAALLPLVMAARFQEAGVVRERRQSARGPGGPQGQARRRARLQPDHRPLAARRPSGSFGVAPQDSPGRPSRAPMSLEYADPPFVKRAEPGKDLLNMLHDGELDAIIVGNDVPDDPELDSVFPDPAAAAEAFWSKHDFVPINHVVVIRTEHALERTGAARRARRAVCRLQGRKRQAEAGARPFAVRRAPSSLRRMACGCALDRVAAAPAFNLQGLWRTARRLLR